MGNINDLAFSPNVLNKVSISFFSQFVGFFPNLYFAISLTSFLYVSHLLIKIIVFPFCLSD